jgi:predicted regulator of Ras-like GTPase activity (Roadblock/LC7/MglB family)
MKVRAKQQRIHGILAKIAAVKGIIFLAIIDREGFSLSSLITEGSEDKVDISALSPLVSALLKQIESVSNEIAMQDTREITVEYASGILKINQIPERKEFLVTLADSRSNLSLLRMETKKHIKTLTTEL